MLLNDLEKRELIRPPKWLSDNCQYLCLSGSVAYGVSSDTSDCDCYGWTIPPKFIVFPHLTGAVEGFGPAPQKFEQFQQHHVHDKDVGKSYDFSIYNIVKFFDLCAGGNPNMVDALFVPNNCVLHITQIGQMVRDNRRLFLHKGCWHRFKGYAYQQKNKAVTKVHEGLNLLVQWEEDHGVSHTVSFGEVVAEANLREISMPEGSLAVPLQYIPESTGIIRHLNDADFSAYLKLYHYMMTKSKRAERVKIDGTDRKFLYHVVRLLDEAEQILTLGDLDLQRAREQMKAVRRGDMTEKDVDDYFTEKEAQLEKVYQESKLQYEPDWGKLKSLLLQCLEHHYGSLDKLGFVNPDAAVTALRQIQEIIDKNKGLLA